MKKRILKKRESIKRKKLRKKNIHKFLVHDLKPKDFANMFIFRENRLRSKRQFLIFLFFIFRIKFTFGNNVDEIIIDVKENYGVKADQ